MSLIEPSPNSLTATLTGLRQPLRAIDIGEQQSNRLLTEGTVARFHRNWQIEFFFLDSRSHVMLSLGSRRRTSIQSTAGPICGNPQTVAKRTHL